MTTIQLDVGDYQELSWGSSSVGIEILEVSKIKAGNDRETYAASIRADPGGGLGWVYGGEKCERIEVNTYRVPRKGHAEELYSVYSFATAKDYFRFFRVYVDHINPKSRQTTLNIFFARWVDLDRLRLT
jgi:hypothetical protein